MTKTGIPLPFWEWGVLRVRGIIMTSHFKQVQPLQGLLKDQFISFNIGRSPGSYAQFPRKVILLPASRLRKTIIPGIKEKTERNIIKELKSYQNWQHIRKNSFQIPPYIFSFMWRFSKAHHFIFNNVRAIELLGKNEARRVIVAFRKYQTSLRHNLSPGHVYLIPDSEVLFENLDRHSQPYARRILIINSQKRQLLVIPFTSQLRRMNRETDVLFDHAHKGPRLDPSGVPPVESFPYKIFTRKAVLRVEVTQPFTEEDFVGSALTSLGVLKTDLLDFVQEKMKEF